jgi:hypothetical protein
MFGEQFIARGLCQTRITYKDRDDVGRTRYDWNVDLFKALFDLPNIDLFELAITNVVLLVNDTCARTSYSCRGERGRKDEAGCIGSDHVNEVV